MNKNKKQQDSIHTWTVSSVSRVYSALSVAYSFWVVVSVTCALFVATLASLWVTGLSHISVMTSATTFCAFLLCILAKKVPELALFGLASSLGILGAYFISTGRMVVPSICTLLVVPALFQVLDSKVTRSLGWVFGTIVAAAASLVFLKTEGFVVWFSDYLAPLVLSIGAIYAIAQSTKRMGDGVRDHLMDRVSRLEGQITEAQSQNAELETDRRKFQDQARRDELTGIYNRRMLRVTMEAFSLESMPYSLILIDVDHFKKVNDELGHEAGDVVLKEIARVLAETVRDDDLFGRLGGEEFLIILPRQSRDIAEGAAARLLTQVRSQNWGHVGISRQITVSCGVASVVSGEPPDVGMRAADVALYKAKTAGRNRACTN